MSHRLTIALLCTVASCAAGSAHAAVTLLRSAFASAAVVQDHGVLAVGDPISGRSTGGSHTLWHGIPGPWFSAVTATPTASPAPGAWLVVAGPNPCRHHCGIRYSAGGETPVSLDVYDVAGRRVRTLAPDLRVGVADWLLDTDLGGRVPGGLYFIRLRAGPAQFVRRVVVLH